MCGKRKSSWYWVSSWPGTFITPDEHCALPLPHGGRLVIQGAHSRPGLQAELCPGLDVGRGVLQVLERDDGEVGGLQFTLLWGPQDEAAQLCQGARADSSPLLGKLPPGEGHAHAGQVDVALALHGGRGDKYRPIRHVLSLRSFLAD